MRRVRAGWAGGRGRGGTVVDDYTWVTEFSFDFGEEGSGGFGLRGVEGEVLILGIDLVGARGDGDGIARVRECFGGCLTDAGAGANDQGCGHFVWVIWG